MMCQSDSTSADDEIRKPPRELHLSGAPDCLIEKPAVWSFFLRSIVHSSLIILILLFDRILGLPFALQAECSRSTSSIPTSVRAIKVADGSQFVWFPSPQWTTSLHLSPMSAFVFHFCFLAFRAEANLSHSAGGLVLRERHSGSNTNHLGSLSNGQSCIHLSSFLLCCLIESCDLRFASQALWYSYALKLIYCRKHGF